MWRLYPVRILPHIIDTVHVDRSLPLFSLHEVVFRLREPRFSLQLLQTAHLSSPSLTITYVSHTGRLNQTTQPIKSRWIRARIECRGRINAPKFATLWKKKVAKIRKLVPKMNRFSNEKEIYSSETQFESDYVGTWLKDFKICRVWSESVQWSVELHNSGKCWINYCLSLNCCKAFLPRQLDSYKH